MIYFLSVLFMMACVLMLILIFSPLYFKFGWFKWFYHDILGWHQPGKYTPQFYDGCSAHSICKHCGREIMQDSQGNWFC